MRKAIVIVAAVAILGLLAISNKHSDGPALVAPTITSNTGSGTTASSSASQTANSVSYKDGTYTGSTEDNLYGPVQVAAVISNGKITDIKFLQMPSDQRQSQERTDFSEPYLKESAISHQSANIDFVSGATDTSQGFEQSLQAALNQAAAA